MLGREWLAFLGLYCNSIYVVLYPPHAAVSQAAVQSFVIYNYFNGVLRVWRILLNVLLCFHLSFVICHLCEN